MGKVDLHSHLIPGVDDGVRTVDDALRTIEGLIERGYDRLMTTPHQVEFWRPATDVLESKLLALQEEILRRGWPVVLGMGAECHLDEAFLRRHREGRLLSYGLAGRALLLELSPFSPPPFLRQLVFELKAAGIVPVVAHPERYPWLLSGDGHERVRGLREGGCLFQVDLGSFAGCYGREARRTARRLVQLDAVDLVASDLHGPDKIPALVDDGLRALGELVSAATLFGLTEERPGEIFRDAVTGRWGGKHATGGA